MFGCIEGDLKKKSKDGAEIKRYLFLLYIQVLTIYKLVHDFLGSDRIFYLLELY